MIRLLCLGVVLAAASATLRTQCSQLSNTPPGTDLQLADESVRQVRLPFAFPFAGTTYTAISVCSNGFLWLGANTASDFSPSESEALAQPPRILPLWLDLDPGAGGTVTFAATATEASICWNNVPQWHVPAVTATFECVLASSGAIAFRYGATTGVPTVATLIGITAGNGAAANPRAFAQDIANAAAIAGSTATEFATGNAPLPLVASGWLQLQPAGAGYTVGGTALSPCAPGVWPPAVTATPVSYGVGCPAAVPHGAIYQWFTDNAGTVPVDLGLQSLRFQRNGGSYALVAGPGLDPGYTTNGVSLPMGDDTVQAGLSLGAMAVFPFGGLPLTQVSACSNGYVWLGQNLNADFGGVPAELVGQGARLAPYWLDLDFGLGGSFWWQDTDPAYCQATWASVREFGLPGAVNTFQLRLYANGDFAFSYGALAGASAGRRPLVGVAGGPCVDPGATDLVLGGVATPVSRPIVGTTPMTLAMGRAAIGLPLLLTAAVPAPSNGFGLFAIGHTQFDPGVSLASLGAAGCAAHTSLDYLFFQSFGGSTMAASVPVPYANGLVGLGLFAQAAAGTSANTFGLFTSNGMAFALGLGL